MLSGAVPEVVFALKSTVRYRVWNRDVWVQDGPNGQLQHNDEELFKLENGQMHDTG
jgi:hypothetical protein